MNNRSIYKLFSSGEAQQPCDLLDYPIQPQNQSRQRLVDEEQIDGEKDHGNQGDDGRVLNLAGARPGHTFHLGPHVVQKLSDSSGRRTAFALPTFAARGLAFRPLTKARRSGRHYSGIWIVCFSHNSFLPLIPTPSISVGRGTRIPASTFGFGDRRANR